MAIKITNDIHYQAIADAIREQNGETTTYTPSEMAQAILDIEGGGSSGITTDGWVNLLANGDFSDGLTGWDGVVTGGAEFNPEQFEIVNEDEFTGIFGVLVLGEIGDTYGLKNDQFSANGGDKLYFATKAVAWDGDGMMHPETETICMIANEEMSIFIEGEPDFEAIPLHSTIDFADNDYNGAAFYHFGLRGGVEKSIVNIAIQWACVLNLTDIYGDDIPEKAEIDALIEGFIEGGGGGTCFDTSQITSAQYLFSGYGGLSLDLKGLNTENVTSMSYMFRDCSALTSLDLSSFNTGNVTNMSYMFQNCPTLTSLDLSSFNTGNVTNMSYMFQNCPTLTSLDLSSFDTENVTSVSYMFRNCSAITSLDLSSFNTGNVTNMSYMFRDCSALTSLDLSSFNTGNVTSMSAMFERCSALTSLDLSSFDTGNVTSMNYMLRDCSSLQTVFARSQADATKIMSASNTPSGITFKNHDGTIYGVTS